MDKENIFILLSMGLLALAIGTLLLSGGIWLICWAFGLTFQWSYVIGALAIGFVFNLLTNKGNS